MPNLNQDKANRLAETVGLTMPEIKVSEKLTMSISDHHPVLQNTAYGCFATYNLTAPGARLAPVVKKATQIETFPREIEPERMKATAKFIHRMFAMGVVVLALQEVPPSLSKEFQELIAELRNLGTDDNLIRQIKLYWSPTYNINEKRMQNFGTSLICQTGLSVSAIEDLSGPFLKGRGAIYSVVTPRGEIKVANLHGSMSVDGKNHQQATIAFINAHQGIALGDLNVSPNDLPEENSQPDVLRAISMLGAKVNGTIVEMNTVDAIFDNISRRLNPDYIPSVERITQPQELTSNAAIITPIKVADEVIIPAQFNYELMVRAMTMALNAVNQSKLTNQKESKYKNLLAVKNNYVNSDHLDHSKDSQLIAEFIRLASTPRKNNRWFQLTASYGKTNSAKAFFKVLESNPTAKAMVNAALTVNPIKTRKPELG